MIFRMEISVVMSVSVTRHASLFARKILMLVTRSRSHKYAAYNEVYPWRLSVFATPQSMLFDGNT